MNKDTKQLLKERKGQGQKISDELIEQIKAMVASGMSKQSVANQLNMSWSTIDKYSQEIDNLEEIREERKRIFIEKCWDSIYAGVDLGLKKIEESAKTAEEWHKELAEIADKMRKDGTDEQVIEELIRVLARSKDIPLAQISTFIGTLYDKQALAHGDPTERVEVVSWDDLE